MDRNKLTAKQKKHLRTLESEKRFYKRQIDKILYFKKANPVIEFEEELKINAVLKELRSKLADICDMINTIYREESIPVGR